MSSSFGYDLWRFAFYKSPIFLVEGLAKDIPGGILPLVLLTESFNVGLGLLNFDLPTLDNTFATWQPQPGTQLLRYSVAQYPFANQAIAANAVIQEPLAISMVMICPMQRQGAATLKAAEMTAIKFALEAHIQEGGLFNIATPSYIFTDCILTGITDVSGGEGKQDQTAWQFDFIQPLIATPEQTKLNSFISKLTSGLPV